MGTSLAVNKEEILIFFKPITEYIYFLSLLYIELVDHFKSLLIENFMQLS